MLVLTRRIDERICIGADIEIIVTRIDRGYVKIGIQAPKSIPVMRGELSNKGKSSFVESIPTNNDHHATVNSSQQHVTDADLLWM